LRKLIRHGPGRLSLVRTVGTVSAGDGLKKFEPVTVRILAVEAPHPWELVIEPHRVPGVPQSVRPGIQSGYQQARMGFARGPEVLLDANMEFYVVAFEPATAACGQYWRFLDFVQSKDTDVELAER
jgi:hypothetical protein